jgi:hypothetical protein
MMSTLARLVTVVALMAALWADGLRAQSNAVALTNVTLVDATGAPPSPAMTVIVNGDRITAIGRADSIRVPRGAILVDGTGKFLIPGLWDMHVHIGSYEDGVKVLPRLVGYGITGVRDMASPIDDILRLRQESTDRVLLGPQIVAAGPILQGPLPFRLPPLVRTVTEADANQTVAELKAKTSRPAVCRTPAGLSVGLRGGTVRTAQYRAFWKCQLSWCAHRVRVGRSGTEHLRSGRADSRSCWRTVARREGVSS